MNDSTGRRATQRRELLAEIADEARRLLELGGPSAVGWNAIARKVGLSPASLYTYFASLDDLFTELLLQSYRALSAAVESALDAFADAPVGDRLLIGPLGYRSWALANRAQFNLVFTDQISGYAAPPQGPTVEAQIAVLRPMSRTFAEALGIDPSTMADEAPPLDLFLGFWGAFHGLTSLEVNHHLDWIEPDSLFEGQVRWYLRQLDLPAANEDAARRFESVASKPRKRQTKRRGPE